MNLHTKVVLLFAGMGGAAGVISAFVHSLLALFLAFVFFYLVYKQAPRMLKFQPSEFPPIERVKKGFFPHFIAWLIVWIMVYTLFVVG
jgi:hypothetical protein